MSDMYSRLAPFIQDYIYKNGWSEFRQIQIAACDKILDTDDNLLLASGTASGKTEAAFLPILTDIYNHPSNTVGVLYISPLKALINDQFIRIEDILKEANIPVTKWHGDVTQTQKSKILKNPKGIMQTTPESLEAMLMRNPGNIIKLFSDLRYIVIDEVHYLMSDDRGLQLLCILERIQKIIKKEPRRIGLSATLGDYNLAKKWLSSGTKRKCDIPIVSGEKRRIRLGVKYFNISDKNTENDSVSILEYYNELYKATLNKKCILFSNSKAEVENNISHLKKIAKEHHTKDIYYVHHANISASIRKYAEEQMKQDEEKCVTGATVTLELGIDLGKLDRIIQTGAPLTVSSFVQRLGRSGRRGQPAEMLFFFKEEKDNRTHEFYQEIQWDFIKCIAVIELYLKEKWIEPMEEIKMPFSLLYHQTMSYLFQAGSSPPKELAKNILTLTPFKYIQKEDYKILLKYLLEKEEIEKDEQGDLLIGIKGEKKVNSFNFFSVFSTPIEYSVRSGTQEIGTVQMPYPIGQKFALAGFNWKVVDINEEKRQIFVKKIGGISSNTWNDEGEFYIHTKILKKMKEILEPEKTIEAGEIGQSFGYLDSNSKQKLKEARIIAKKTGILQNRVVKIVENTYAIFPWLGTKQIIALSYCLKQEGITNKIYYRAGVPIFIETKTKKSIKEVEKILEKIKNKSINKEKIEIPNIAEKSGKYNYFIPKELLKKQYKEDCLDIEGMKENL